MKKLATTTAIALTNLFIGYSAMADDIADYTPPSCVDDRGEAVTYHSEYDPTIDYKGMVMYAGARYLNLETLSTPVIIYDESFVEGMSKVMFDFTMAHECFHLKSGDARQAYASYLADIDIPEDEEFRLESRANCAAAHDLREVFDYKPEDIDVLEAEMRERMSNRHVREFMPIIKRCFANNTPRPE